MAKKQSTPKPYVKPDQIEIRGNEIFSPLRQKWLKATPSEIDQSRLVIADLTDERPNVYCEVGYAKSKGIPFILTFHKRRRKDKPPWDRESSPGNKVHFDLTPYRYIAYETAFDLRDRLKQELDAFVERAS